MREKLGSHAAAVRADVQMPLCVADLVGQDIGQSDILQDAHHLMVDVNSAGKRMRFGRLFDDERADTRLAQKVGRDPAYGAAAYDGHVVIQHCRFHPRRVCGSSFLLVLTAAQTLRQMIDICIVGRFTYGC